MSKKVRIKEGDVFEVSLNNNSKGYFQFIGLDSTQLNSEVIRVFKKIFQADEPQNLEDVVKDEVQFYAHVVIKFGIKMNLWKKVGSVPLEPDLEKPFFRDSGDYGKPEIKISHDWYVWRVNEEFKHVGSLKGEQIMYDIGIIVNPLEIVHRMNTGDYSFVYPSFQ